MSLRASFNILLWSSLLIVIHSKDSCPVENGEAVGEVENSDLDECSGLVQSRQYQDVLWSHNDHGDKARIFAMKQNGVSIGQYNLEGIEHEDFEDITIGHIDGDWYLFVADTGQNDPRDFLYIYAFPEPDPADLKMIARDTITTFRFEAPKNEDFETLLFDQKTGYLYLVQKDREGSKAHVYKFKPEITNTNIDIDLELLGTMPRHFLTAGDISMDGSLIALKNKEEGWIYYREEGRSVEQALLEDPVFCDINLQDEEQGEAIAFSTDGKGFFTSSEGKHEPIFFYKFD